MGVTAAWDRYWHADRIASCMDGAGRSNYDDRVAKGWRDFFRQLPDGSRILDLCTGNGAVAVIAAEVDAIYRKRFAITGIDLADIDPVRFVHRLGVVARNVTFIANASCEDMQFPDSCFDAVVSQYGVEYSDLDKTLREAARVMAPGAKLRLFMHAKEGTVVASTKKAIADADFLIDKAKLCDKAALAFRAVHVVEDGDESPEAVRRADRCHSDFRASLESCGRYLRRCTDEAMVRNSTSVLLHAYENRRSFPPDKLVAKANELKEEVLAHRFRQRALVSAAVNARRVAQLAVALAGLGLSDVTSSEVRPGAEFVGYVVEGEKKQA
jgi:SAM-dependent methyltransferase